MSGTDQREAGTQHTTKCYDDGWRSFDRPVEDLSSGVFMCCRALRSVERIEQYKHNKDNHAKEKEKKETSTN